MIQINDNWRMTSDESCVILEKKCIVNVRKDGKETGETKEQWNTYGYHADFKQALTWMIRNEVQVCDEYITIVKKIEELEKLISSLKLVE